MFLADINTASFSTPDDKKKKVGMLGMAKNIVVGKTLPGMLTRAAGVGTIGAGLYGGIKAKNILKNKAIINNDPFGYRREYRIKQALKPVGDVAKIGTGVAVGGGALNMAQREYDRRNRKWWELL
jgi:hypothetical protein